jgi:transposase-like protein
MLSLLAGVDVNNRFDYFNDFTIAVSAFGGVDVEQLADSERDLSAKRYIYFWVDGIHVQARLEESVRSKCSLSIVVTPVRGEEAV